MEATKNDRIFLLSNKNLTTDTVSERSWKGFVVHHSQTNAGHTVFNVDDWHLKNGWDGIGYAFVIGQDAKIYSTHHFIKGTEQAHASKGNNAGYNWNKDYLGICVLGDFNHKDIDSRQFGKLLSLITALTINNKDIGLYNLLGHCMIDVKKTCPGYYLSSKFSELYFAIRDGIEMRYI